MDFVFGGLRFFIVFRFVSVVGVEFFVDFLFFRFDYGGVVFG